MTRHLFILNPAAGRRDKTPALTQMIHNLLLSEPYDIFVTDSVCAAERETERYIRAYPNDFIRIYACGGDGTVSEVANGIYKSGSKSCALAIIPIGSGNDFVRSFDLPADRFTNLRALTKAEYIDTDLLLASDTTGKERVSLNIISAGFDAAVAKGQEKYKKLPMVNGSTAYNLSLVKCLFSSLKNYFNILVDGKSFSNRKNGPYLFVIAANGKYYGGGFKASPYSDMRDGLIDFVRIDTVSRLRFIKLVGIFREGKHLRGHEDIVSFTRCKKMQIVSELPIDLNLDGEIISMRNPTVKVIPKAINLIVPQE